MASRINYRDMARVIRRVEHNRAQRARQEAPGEGVALDQVLGVLDSSDGKDDVAALVDDARNALAEAKRKQATHGSPFAVHIEDQFLPADPLLANVVQQLSFAHTTIDADSVPRAVVTALAQVAAQNGVVDVDTASQRLGPWATRILSMVDKAGHAGTSHKERLDGVSGPVAAQVVRSTGDKRFLQRMPLLDEMLQQLGGKTPMKGVRMASVQHLFPTTEGLFRAFTLAGAPPEDHIVGGKNYSTNVEAYHRMDAEGYDTHWMAAPRAREAGLDAEKVVKDMARAQLERMFADTPPDAKVAPPFLLLDDGGKLIDCLHREFPERVHQCVAVEQTDRGIQVLEKLEDDGIAVGCPVVNMARSWCKKDIEGPVIGESVVFHMEHALDQLAVDPKEKTACLVGFGAVGEAVAASLLRRGYTVVVTDPDPAAQQRAQDMGCTPMAKEDALAQGHVLVGCTGKQSVTLDDLERLPDGAVLVNAASGNHELSLHELGEADYKRIDPHLDVDDQGRLTSSFAGQDLALGDLRDGADTCHRVLRSADGKERLALRSGYVVNMTLGLPPEYVQLTLGLLLASCLQAVDAQQPGLVDLDDAAQQFITLRTRKHLSGIGKTLDTPDFRGLDSWTSR